MVSVMPRMVVFTRALDIFQVHFYPRSEKIRGKYGAFSERKEIASEMLGS